RENLVVVSPPRLRPKNRAVDRVEERGQTRSGRELEDRPHREQRRRVVRFELDDLADQGTLARASVPEIRQADNRLERALKLAPPSSFLVLGQRDTPEERLAGRMRGGEVLVGEPGQVPGHGAGCS